MPIADVAEPEKFKIIPVVPTYSTKPLDSYLLFEGDYEESYFESIVFESDILD